MTRRPQKVIFMGGEPLLRPGILELLRGLKLESGSQEQRACIVQAEMRTLAHHGCRKLAEPVERRR